jgi:hypothetical protein
MNKLCVPEHKVHAEKFRKRELLQQVFIIHNDGSQDFIQLKKTLGHIYNYHTLLIQSNSSY